MSLCICGHAQKEHLSSDGLDNSCQVDKCECSNYATPTQEERASFVQLGWVGGAYRQDSSEPDTSTQETTLEGHQADYSSVATADTRQESNTNTQTRTAEQEADVVAVEVK